MEIMCGIVGIWDRSGKEYTENISHFVEKISHRGPDDRGEWRDKAISFGFCRLAILDTSSAGHQPMSTPDGHYTLMFNGEIYNFKELQKKYLSDIKFTSTSDTEVLLYLLAQKKEAILPELRGMFALALWDKESQELLLARDPFGKKPLYYVQQKDLFAFASEPKALLLHPAVTKTIDQKALTAYFQHEYIPSPASGWQDIQQLPMGNWLKITTDSIEMKCYWKPHFYPKHTLTERKALEKLDGLLAQAVERRMISDVPVGIFLSGGLDSTTIAWYMRRVRKEALHSFSISFDDASFDEGNYAKQVAEFLGTTHHDTTFTLRTFHEALKELVPLMDVPLADASLLPTYILSKQAKQYITVALDGDGSDELFAGYGTFKAAEVADALSFLPRPLISILKTTAEQLPTTHSYFSLDFKVKSFLKGLGYSRLQRNQLWLGAFTPLELKKLLKPLYQTSLATIFSELDALEDPKLSTLDAISKATIYHYLHNDILLKLDRASMFASVETRTPFLDTDLADFVMALPEKFKRRKYLLKKLMYGRIPKEIIMRPKKGFGIPLGGWLQKELHDFTQKTLNQDKLEQNGILVPAYVQQLLQDHTVGKRDNRKQIWTLLTFQLWYDQYYT